MICYNLLQYAAICCNTLRYVAVCCTRLQYATRRCNILRYAAICCNMQRDAAICCAMLQYVQFNFWHIEKYTFCRGRTSASLFETLKSMRSVEAERPAHFLRLWKVCVLSRQNVCFRFSEFEKYAFCRGRMPGPLFPVPRAPRRDKHFVCFWTTVTRKSPGRALILRHKN